MKVWIEDDRGRRVRFGFARNSALVRALPEDIRKTIGRKRRRDLLRDKRFWAVCVAGGSLLFVVMCVGLLGLSYQRSPLIIMGMMILGFVPAVVVPANMAFATRHHLRTRLYRIVLEERYCPNCGYNLVGTPPASDGCRACSECGCAWRLSD